MRLARHLRQRRIGRLLILALILAGTGFPSAPAEEDGQDGPQTLPSLPASQPPRNIVLITLDTTRADHLSCYGYARRTSPHIDSLATRGVLFSQATAVVPLTGPGHATMLTGLFPRDHGAVRNGVAIVDEIPTLATILASRGFATGAFVSGWTLRAKLTHLEQGFHHYDDDMTDVYHVVNNQRPGDQTTDRAVAWLQQDVGEAPFFLWLHLFDPHAPYDDHGIELETIAGATRTPPSHNAPEGYDQEIAFADQQVGRVLKTLQDMNVMDSTFILFTADHGESFGEHKETGHGRNLYQTTQHVPLIVSHPAMGPGKISDAPVSTVDVLPTMLDVLGLPPLPGAPGLSLMEISYDPQAHAGREIYQATFPGARRGIWRLFSPRLTGRPLHVAVRRGDWKAIMNVKSEAVMLYDLAQDPDEEQDLAGQETMPTGELSELLVSHAEKEWQPQATEPRMTEEDRRRLKSLGYIN